MEANNAQTLIGPVASRLYGSTRAARFEGSDCVNIGERQRRTCAAVASGTRSVVLSKWPIGSNLMWRVLF